MDRLLKIAYLNVKNVLRTKELLLGIIVAFGYSMLWILVVHPPKYDLEGYSFEFERFLFVIMLYAAVSLLRDDIRFNTSKTVFTGILNRIEIMFSKFISLLMLALIFFVVAEINNILASVLLHSKIGIIGFFAHSHIQMFITYVVTTIVMGSIMLLIVSISFNESKSILFYILFLAMINFYTSGITMLVFRNPELKDKLWGYMITPFYNVSALNQGIFTVRAVLISLIWALVFLLATTVVISRREIK